MVVTNHHHQCIVGSECLATLSVEELDLDVDVDVIYFFCKSFTRYGNSHVNNNKRKTAT
jgi:hypothetical protein